jgi:hypothetical protein
MDQARPAHGCSVRAAMRRSILCTSPPPWDSGGVRAVTVSNAVIKIPISAEAFEAIVESLPFGIVTVEPERAPDGSVEIWLAPNVLEKLQMLRRPSESYSDVILALTGR